MTPTNYVWPASQDRVPSVWCCPTPHWLVNEGLRGGSRGGEAVVAEWEGQRSEKRGWCGPHSLCSFNCKLVSGQLLIHSSSATITNRGHTRAGRQRRARPSGTLAGSAGPPEKKARRSISPLSLRKQSCLYWTGCEERLTAFFSLPPFSFSPHLYLFPPSCLFISPAPLPAVFLISPSCLPSSSFNLLLWNKSTAV